MSTTAGLLEAWAGRFFGILSMPWGWLYAQVTAAFSWPGADQFFTPPVTFETVIRDDDDVVRIYLIDANDLYARSYMKYRKSAEGWTISGWTRELWSSVCSGI